MEKIQLTEVNEYYSNIARKLSANESTSCCDTTTTSSSCCGEETSNTIPSLGSTADLFVYADPEQGETVLDLGSGPGSDALRAATLVGKTGKVIGVDFSDDMLRLARENASLAGLENVQFLKGNLMELPLEDESIDLVISNCVINLAPNKTKVLEETARVLKPGGRFIVSDMVAISQYPESFVENSAALCGCVSGAISEEEYRSILQTSGFHQIAILRESTNSIEFENQPVTFGSSIIMANKKTELISETCDCDTCTTLDKFSRAL